MTIQFSRIMKHPLLALALAPLGLWAAFVLPDTLASNPGFWDWRRTLVILSGIFSLWWMSAGILLAGRPGWLERRFGGLDKIYRLHRNIGIGAGVFVFMHWMLEWLPKKLSRLGWFAGNGCVARKDRKTGGSAWPRMSANGPATSCWPWW